jgi:hypothetical protein
VRGARRYATALAAGTALLLPVGCGSSDEEGEPLPRDAVAAIADRLDEVQDRYEDGTRNNNPGACDDIETDSYKAIDSQVEGLPEDVDADVRDALEESLARLQDLTREGCADVEERPEPKTTPEETVPDRTVPEETVPEQTDTQETVPDQTKPKQEKKQNGNGNGNGETTPPADTVVPPGNSGGQVAPDADDG